jgi:hypothetical protein
MSRRYVFILALVIMISIIFIFSGEAMAAGPDGAKSYVKTMRDGIIRGGLGGLILGNYSGIIENMVSYGVVSPIMQYLE